ncbi:16798_t:CDS:2, partial [Acaulospora colombiana]
KMDSLPENMAIENPILILRMLAASSKAKIPYVSSSPLKLHKFDVELVSDWHLTRFASSKQAKTDRRRMVLGEKGGGEEE